MSLFYRVRYWLSEKRKDIVTFFLIFLLCSLSFGLGYLVNRDYNRVPIVIEKGELGIGG